MRLKKKHAPYVFISPFFILFFIFGAFPILFSLYLSFFRWDGMSA
ncbi:MAG: sugar ABC transporter permease, partial [Halanaerobium sp.]